MRKLFEIGGLAAAAVLIVFGVVAIAMGVNGRHTVQNSLSGEYIVGTPDMNKTTIAAEAKSRRWTVVLGGPEAANYPEEYLERGADGQSCYTSTQEALIPRGRIC